MFTLTCSLHVASCLCYRVTHWLWAKWGKATEELRRMGDRQFQMTERIFLRTQKVPQVLLTSCNFGIELITVVTMIEQHNHHLVLGGLLQSLLTVSLILVLMSGIADAAYKINTETLKFAWYSLYWRTCLCWCFFKYRIWEKSASEHPRCSKKEKEEKNQGQW